MAVLTPDGLADLQATTLRNLHRPKFVQIATSLQDYPAMRMMLRKGHVVMQSGKGASWEVMVNHSQSFSNVGLGQQDNPGIIDSMVTATADWKGSSVNWSLIGEEEAMNSGEEQIVDLILTRRVSAMISMAEGMERNFWGPPVSLSDTLTPWGVNTWIVKNATEGFNGGAPSGHTTIGLNPSTYSRWKNYTAPYSAISRDDFVRKAKKALSRTNFMAPPKTEHPTLSTGTERCLYTNLDAKTAIEELGEDQNDNIGFDLDSQYDRTVIRRLPLEWVPFLDSDTTNPIYGLNWAWIKILALKGWWLKETMVKPYPGQHTMATTFMDIRYQNVWYNRREHFVISNGTSYPS